MISDNYKHIAKNVIYIKENIPCAVDLDDLETLEIHENFNHEFSESCSCSSECSTQNRCPCALKYGDNYIKSLDLKGSPQFSLHLSNIDKPHVECSIHCACSGLCGNRLVQLGPATNLMVVPTSGKGFGLKTELDMQKFSFVCEYAGEVLSPKLATHRYKHNQQNGIMNYIFCLNEILAAGEVIKTYIDPSEFGNIGRYLNHSCSPNCFVVPIRANVNVPKLCIFTAKNIVKGEELTFDYGSGKHLHYTDKQKIQLTRCLCNTSTCRGWLPCEIDEEN